MSCASISSPQGGPKDSLPPRVLETKPLYYSTNFEGKKVEIEFDEFVVFKDQQQHFFVSPESAKKPKLTTKGKSVIATFEDTLQKDKTYRLDFGNSIVDNNESNKLENFHFTFSTGDYVDSVMMVGQTLDAFTRDTILGAFVKYFPVAMDSTYSERGLDSTMYKSYADAIFRSDSSGYFLADILQDKPYRVYAYLDNNSSHTYEAGTDLVGFTDLVYNPTELSGFAFGYDSIRKRYVVDSLQVVFELFKEEALKRQTFLSASRPLRNKLQFEYNMGNAAMYLDSLQLSGINKEWLIEERSRLGDSLIYWIAPPTKAELDSLKDTIRARFIYLGQDSVFRATPMLKEQNLIHKIPKKELTSEEKKEQREQQRQERREARGGGGQGGQGGEGDQRGERPEGVQGGEEGERGEREGGQGDEQGQRAEQGVEGEQREGMAALDSTSMPGDSLEVEKPKMAFKVDASQMLNPEKNIVMYFDYPLTLVDSSRIELVQKVTEEKRGVRRGQTAEAVVTETKIKPRVTLEGLRKVTISADWVYGGDYSLMIPEGVFEDITFVSNDTLESQFVIMHPDKFGSLIFNINGTQNQIQEQALDSHLDELDLEVQGDEIEAEGLVLEMEALADSVATDSVEVEDLIVDSVVIDSGMLDKVEVDSMITDSLLMVDSVAKKEVYVPVLEQEVIDSLVAHYTIKSPIGQGDSSTMYYIVELVKIKKSAGVIAASSSDKTTSNQEVVQRRIGVKIGDKVEFRFLDPGEYYLRLIEDRDRNGEWTTGDLRNRKQAERSRIYSDAMGRKRFEAKENWEIVEEVDIVQQMNKN